MKNFVLIILLGLFIYSCGAGKDREFQTKGDSKVTNDTVRIANDSLEYEVIIFEPGFQTFLNSVAQPRGYYSQEYLERKNRILVQEYNIRVRQPFRYNPNLYVQEINYEPNVDYGYEVNYLLYNYFVYFSRKYNQSFPVPTRI